jgi:hypothetical protein
VTNDIVTPRVKELLEQRDTAWFNARLAGKSYNDIAMDANLNPDRFTAQGISFTLVKYCNRHKISTDILKGGDNR